MAREFAKEEQEHVAFMRAFLGAGAPNMPSVRPAAPGIPVESGSSSVSSRRTHEQHLVLCGVMSALDRPRLVTT